MVAQSCETPAGSQWGRTSPIAATTPLEHQPMDLVKRKPGKSDCRPNDCGSPKQAIDLQQRTSINQPRHQSVPHGSQDEAQQPQGHHPKVELTPQELQLEGQVDKQQLNKDNLLQLSQNCYIIEQDHLVRTQTKEWSSLASLSRDQSLTRGSQDTFDKLTPQQQSKPCSPKQLRQEMMSRWEHESAQMQKNETEKSQGKLEVLSQQQGLKPNVHYQKVKLVHPGDSPQLIKGLLPSVQVNQTKIQESDFQNELSSEESLLKEDEVQSEEANHTQLQDESSEVQEYEFAKQDNPEQPIEVQEIQFAEQDTPDQPLRVQDGNSNQHPGNVCEDTSSLLLLADGKPQYLDRVAIPLAQMRREEDLWTDSSVKTNKLSKERLVRVKPYDQMLQSADSKLTEQCHTEDDRDGPLIIADNDCQVVGLENEIPVGEISPSVDPQFVINADGVTLYHLDTLDQDEKQGNAPKSQSRIESQRKMEEGKHWLINNLMFLAGSLSVIKLSDIEEAYLDDCQNNGKESLATPVLARLIHSQFPTAKKCRLGARGHQRIHYRNLQFISDGSTATNVQLSELCTDTPKQNQANSKGSQPGNDQCKPQTKPAIQNFQQDSKRGESANQQQNFAQSTNQQHQQQNFAQSKPCSKVLDESELLNEEDETHNQQMQNNPNQDDEEGCTAAAKKLSEVLKWITGQGVEHRRALLRDFAHSASCQKPTCVPVCLMFRRVRRHVVAAQHSCSVLRLYSMLLRHHVSSCTQPKCGLPACPALRATRPNKRSLELQHQPAKRAAIAQTTGMNRPSNLVLAPRSPLGSLPGSPVNSPPSSPEYSPNLTVPTGQGQVQYVMVMMPVVGNRGA